MSFHLDKSCPMVVSSSSSDTDTLPEYCSGKKVPYFADAAKEKLVLSQKGQIADPQIVDFQTLPSKCQHHLGIIF
jgi:hypothetical protein